MNLTDYITVSAAAELTGKRRVTIIKRINDGTLTAVKPASEWLVLRASVENYRDNPPKCGNPNWGRK